MTNCLRNVFLSVFLLSSIVIIAQPSLQKMQTKLAAERNNSAASFYKFELNSKMPSQAGLLLSPDLAISRADVQTWLSAKLELRSGVDVLKQLSEKTTYGNTQISRMQQYYNGIKVEHGIIAQVESSNKVRLLQMEFYPIPSSLKTTPSISIETALGAAVSFVGAKEYAWQNNPTNSPEYAKPTPELVIVEDIFSGTKGRMCLAYKFDIFATSPASRQYIYVDAADGKVVFSDVVIKHLSADDQRIKRSEDNEKAEQKQHGLPVKVQSVLKQSSLTGKGTSYSLASGFLRYSGTQNFFTEEMSPTSYRLHSINTPNNIATQTFNANNLAFPALTLASITDFTDADNDWSEASYISDGTYAVLDAHWGMEQVVDYWWNVHNRKSFDNNSAPILGICHYGNNFDGAFWNSQGKILFMGDGGTTNGVTVNHVTSLDVVAHEIGHGICDYTARLVYKRESGALNEGFSDIWAACVENYVNKNDPSLNKQPFLIADQIMDNPDVKNCLRDMSYPRNQGQPDTYKDFAGDWFDVNVENCPVPISSDSAFGNDFCGVHKNSGVLNKWFYIIAHGDTSTNAFGEQYDIPALGFEKAEKIAYYTEMILTPNSGFEAARIASLNAVQILSTFPNAQGITLADTGIVSQAWRAVGVYTDSIYNMANTPVFASNFFTSIAVGTRGYIWAGTSNNGLYKYDGKVWQKSTTLTNHNISQILPDREGGIWIAQYGRSGAQAILGGIGYYQDTSFNYLQYSSAEGVPTRNVRSIFINNELSVTQKYQRVWAACFSDLTGSTTRPGAVTRGMVTPVSPQYFDKTVNGIYQVNGFCQTIGGNKNEVWVFASSNTPSGTNQIVRYRTADTTFIGTIDNSNVPDFPVGFTAKAIYFDNVKLRWWIGLSNGGIVVRDSATHTWISINFPTIFPAGTIVNNNAITGDTQGNIYIGTSQGYVFFGSANSSVVLNPLDVSQYKVYTTSDGLPSNNIRSIAIDYRASRVLLATDNGIAFKYLLCKECVNSGPVFSIMPGNWSNPGIWASGSVPGLNANVVVRHAVTVDQDANCNSIKVETGGNVTVKTGVILNVESASYNANIRQQRNLNQKH